MPGFEAALRSVSLALWKLRDGAWWGPDPGGAQSIPRELPLPPLATVLLMRRTRKAWRQANFCWGISACCPHEASGSPCAISGGCRYAAS